MWMDPEEILSSYNKAGKKSAQIGVLAELNACTKEEIIGLLIEKGVPEDELRKKKGGRRKAAKEEQCKDCGGDRAEGEEGQAEGIPGGREDAALGGDVAKLAGMKMDVGDAARPMPEGVLQYLNMQKIALTERIEQDTEKLEAITRLLKAFFK